MLGKLAYRNARRSVKDYLVYLITITISFSLIFAFHLVAGSKEVTELSYGMGAFNQLLVFINIIIVFVTCFLIHYTTRFMFEKRSREFGTYMLLGIKKKAITKLFVIENVILGFGALMLAVPSGFVFSQFVSLLIVRILGIPKVVFITMDTFSICLLIVYFAVIYLLVLINMLRKIRKMTVHHFIYFEKQNEKKMFQSSKSRNFIFIISLILVIGSLLVWNSCFDLEAAYGSEAFTYALGSLLILIIGLYGLSATSADMMLSFLMKSKKIKYQKDNLFVARTFASKARSMSFTFGTLSMLILLSVLAMNYSSINKAVYYYSIESHAPYDIMVWDDKDSFDEYISVIKEDYTIKDSLEYDVYRDENHQVQNSFDIQFYDFDPVIKLSDYNKMRSLRGMDAIELKENEYLVVTDKRLLSNTENNNDISTVWLSNGKALKYKGTDTQLYWIYICNNGYFTKVVPDVCTEELEIAESHLIVETKEDTTAEFDEKLKQAMEHRLITVDRNGEEDGEYYRVQTRGLAIEEKNTMVAMTASLCLYIAFIMISAVGTILAVQSLSDSAKYQYRYLTLRRLGVNDKALYRTIRKQLFMLFSLPAVCSVICGFCLVTSINHLYQLIMKSRYEYLVYFAGNLALFFLIYGIYWITAYIGFKRNINEVRRIENCNY